MSRPEAAPFWRRGIVKQVDAAAFKARVQLPDEDGILTDWLPVLAVCALGARLRALPRLESQVVVLLDEHGEDGAVLGGVYSQADPAPAGGALLVDLEMEDGTRITLDPDASLVAVDTPGTLTAKAGQAATLEAPAITLKGPVTIEGTLAVTENATLQKALTVSNDATIGGKAFLQHKHTSAPSGSPTSVPV